MKIEILFLLSIPVKNQILLSFLVMCIESLCRLKFFVQILRAFQVFTNLETAFEHMVQSMQSLFLMKILIIFFFAALSMMGCDTQKISDDPLDEGIQKIDSGDYEGAIVYLQDLLNREPNDNVRIALATAYVGRAGVEIADYWDIIRIMQQEPINEETIQQSSQYQANLDSIEPLYPILPSDTEEDLQKLFQSVAAFNLYLDRVDILPYVPEENRGDVQQGMAVLDGIASPGGRLYRAVLGVTLLRSDLTDGFDVWDSIEDRLQSALSNPVEAPFIFCSPITGDFVNWILTRFNHTASAAEDLQVAFPEDASDFQPFAESVTELQDSIPEMQDSLVPAGCR